jgi:hypothetical protein
MTLTLSAGSSIDAIETFIGTDDIMDTGFSGLTVTLDDAASVVYSSEKMWGQPSTGSKYTEVDTNFRWGEWNTHRFDKKYDGVTKVKLTFQHAKQAAKLGFSMHQVRVNQVSVANDAWTLAGSIARGSGATALRAVPYAAKWMLKDFVADTGGTSCVAKVEVRGRDIGSRLSDCINLHCEAAFPIGSESAASGYTDSCKTGCHLGAKLWSENAAGKALTACSGFDADLRDSCSVGQKRFLKEDNLFTPLDYESRPKYPVVVEVTGNGGMSYSNLRSGRGDGAMELKMVASWCNSAWCLSVIGLRGEAACGFCNTKIKS